MWHFKLIWLCDTLNEYSNVILYMFWTRFHNVCETSWFQTLDTISQTRVFIDEHTIFTYLNALNL